MAEKAIARMWSGKSFQVVLYVTKKTLFLTKGAVKGAGWIKSLCLRGYEQIFVEQNYRMPEV